MVHEPESSLEDRIEAAFILYYGSEHVERQHVYDQGSRTALQTDESGRRVDLLVNAGIVPVVIECESRSANLIDGMGQVLDYAEHHAKGRAYPALVVADDHVPDDRARDRIERNVPLYEEREIRTILGVSDTAIQNHLDVTETETEP